MADCEMAVARILQEVRGAGMMVGRILDRSSEALSGRNRCYGQFDEPSSASYLVPANVKKVSQKVSPPARNDDSRFRGCAVSLDGN